MQKKFQTPILFIVFNKPEQTKIVLNAIKNINPSKIYISSDASDSEKNIKNVEHVRRIINDLKINKSKVFYKINKKNLGCRNGVVSAIDWFFKNEESGIILEDDCVPNKSFFYFSQQMLNKYKHDKRVFQISGSNPLSIDQCNCNDYYFSKYIRIWGWATWRRAWIYYDKNINCWPLVKKNKEHYNFFYSKKEAIYWEKVWDNCFEKQIDTWDYQFLLMKLLQNGLTIIPYNNLVSNIGFFPDATHTKIDLYGFSNFPTKELSFPLKHPEFVYNKKSIDDLFRSIILKPKYILFLQLIKRFAYQNKLLKK